MKTNTLQSFGKIDYVFIAVIAFLAILYAVFNPLVPADPKSLDIFEITHLVEYTVIGVMAMLYSRKFNWKLEVFSKTYFSLGMAFLSLTIGLVFYYYNEAYVHQPHFLTLSHVLFTAYYPFLIYYLAANSLHFIGEIKPIEKILIFVLPVVLVGIYSFIILERDGYIDGASLSSFPLLALNPVGIVCAIIGIRTFRHRLLKYAWLLIAIGILLEGIGDFGYNYLELFNLYSRAHPIQNLFHIGNLIMIYALYKHGRILK